MTIRYNSLEKGEQVPARLVYDIENPAIDALRQRRVHTKTHAEQHERDPRAGARQPSPRREPPDFVRASAGARHSAPTDPRIRRDVS